MVFWGSVYMQVFAKFLILGQFFKGRLIYELVWKKIIYVQYQYLPIHTLKHVLYSCVVNHMHTFFACLYKGALTMLLSTDTNTYCKYLHFVDLHIYHMVHKRQVSVETSCNIS